MQSQEAADKKHEVKRLERVDEKDEQPAGNGTDKRPEKRDDVRYAQQKIKETLNQMCLPKSLRCTQALELRQWNPSGLPLG